MFIYGFNQGLNMKFKNFLIFLLLTIIVVFASGCGSGTSKPSSSPSSQPSWQLYYNKERLKLEYLLIKACPCFRNSIKRIKLIYYFILKFYISSFDVLVKMKGVSCSWYRDCSWPFMKNPR